MQSITITEDGGGAEIRKIIFYLTKMWLLHWFISRSGIILVLWKMTYGSSEVGKLIYIYRVFHDFRA